MNWNKIGILFLLLIIPVVAIWLCHSNEYGETLVFSRDAKLTEVKTFDDLLGTETTEVKREDGFWLGLLPSVDNASPKALMAVVPMSSILMGLAFISFFINYRKNRKK